MRFLTTLLASAIMCAAAEAANANTGVAQKVTPAVVLIKGIAADGSERAGSGFIVHSSGTIITNLHVIDEMSRAAVKLASGDVFDDVRVRAFDRRRDIAVLQIAGFKLPTLELADSDDIVQGDPVALVGSPFELEGSFSTGVVSAVRPLYDGFRVIQTDAAANPGNSGGPLVDGTGRAVGILSFKRRGSENINFVIPINYARGLLTTDRSLTLDQLRAELRNDKDVFQAPSPAFPARWKSLSSGASRTVRVDGDFIYAETLLTDEKKQLGAFMIYELKKSGDKYVGKVRDRFVCSYPASLRNGPAGYNLCRAEVDIEITLLTPSRIEGALFERRPEDSKFNCAKCSYSAAPSMWKPFVWVPEFAP